MRPVLGLPHARMRIDKELTHQGSGKLFELRWIRARRQAASHTHSGALASSSASVRKAQALHRSCACSRDAAKVPSRDRCPVWLKPIPLAQARFSRRYHACHATVERQS